MDNWMSSCLGELLTLKRGYDLPTSLRNLNGTIPVISSSGMMSYHDEAKVQGPGVVTGRYGTVGAVFYIDEPFWPLNTTLYVQNFKGNDPRFVYQFLQTIDFDKFSGKTGVPGVNRNELHQIPIVIPPLAEQRKIAAILGTWDAAIATAERLIAALRARKRALMQRLLTGRVRFPGFVGDWEEVRLDAIAQVNPGKPKHLEDNTEVSFVGMADVSEDARLVGQEIRKYSEVSNGFTSFQDDDVLIAKITPCLENGKGALVSGLRNGIGFGSTEFHVLRNKPGEVLPEFLYYHTVSEPFRKIAERNMAGSAGQKRVQTNFVSAHRIPLPLLPEQAKICGVLRIEDKNLELLNRYINVLQRQKRALMQRLLTGEVRVAGDASESSAAGVQYP